MTRKVTCEMACKGKEFKHLHLDCGGCAQINSPGNKLDDIHNLVDTIDKPEDHTGLNR